MLIRHCFLALCAFAAAAFGATMAMAQSPACAPDDLRCRVERLEARLATLEAAPQQQSSAPRVIYEAPTETVTVRRNCRTDCQAEAAAVCTERGFAGGRAEDWERPRTGPVALTRATCNRRH